MRSWYDSSTLESSQIGRNQYIMISRLQVVPHSVTTSVDSLRGRPSGIARLNLNLTPRRRGICH